MSGTSCSASGETGMPPQEADIKARARNTARFIAWILLGLHDDVFFPALVVEPRMIAAVVDAARLRPRRRRARHKRADRDQVLKLPAGRRLEPDPHHVRGPEAHPLVGLRQPLPVALDPDLA